MLYSSSKITVKVLDEKMMTAGSSVLFVYLYFIMLTKLIQNNGAITGPPLTDNLGNQVQKLFFAKPPDMSGCYGETGFQLCWCVLDFT